MRFERLDQLTLSMRRMAPVIVQGLVAALLVALPLRTPDSAPVHTVGYSDRDNPTFAQARGEPGAWREMALYAAPTPKGVAWIDWTPPSQSFLSDQPLAVSMSGPFSAQVFFNGRQIGEKGLPATDAGKERAGPIDASFALPAALVRPSGNRIALRLSAHRMGYAPAKIVQSLRVGPYTPDPRRDLRYYAPAILFTGALAAVAAGLALLARARRDSRLLGLVIGMAGLLVALAAEASRALVNYPYDWHQARQVVIGAGVLAFGATLLVFVTGRWPASAPVRRAVLVATLGVVVLVCVLAAGYDAKTTIASLVLLASASAWTAWRGVRGDRSALPICVMLASFPLVAVLAPGAYLDRSVYILAAVMLGGLVVLAPNLVSPAADRRRDIEVLALRTTGRTIFVPIADVVLLKAVGNYTEVHRRQGGWSLDQRGLGALLELMPPSFHRIHRSYAVNQSAVASLTSEEGSRYFLELETGVRLPVGRARVQALRAALGLESGRGAET